MRPFWHFIVIFWINLPNMPKSKLTLCYKKAGQLKLWTNKITRKSFTENTHLTVRSLADPLLFRLLPTINHSALWTPSEFCFCTRSLTVWLNKSFRWKKLLKHMPWCALYHRTRTQHTLIGVLYSFYTRCWCLFFISVHSKLYTAKVSRSHFKRNSLKSSEIIVRTEILGSVDTLVLSSFYQYVWDLDRWMLFLFVINSVVFWTS